jgi:D-sedoheptulose 7-phosphate isomerase
MLEHITAAFHGAQSTLNQFIAEPGNLARVDQMSALLSDALSKGNRIYSCGNGGSSCDAMHFAEELTGRYRKDRKALAAQALCDPAHMTCTANDYGFEYVFSRAVEAYGRPGDVLIALSTSGNSPNVVRAIQTATTLGVKTVGLFGATGGRCKDLVDLAITVKAETTDRIQEIHIKVLHIAIEAVERRLFPELYR